MKRAVAACLLLFGTVAAVSSAGEGRPPRVGIISDEKLRAHADLLMVELQQSNVELVERNEIEKVLKEQSLSLAGLTGKDSLRVGRLLKADGLVMLKQRGKEALLVRLVAVSPAVMVWVEEFATPEKKRREADKLAAAIARTVDGYLPKLSVKAEDAIPVSLMRVKAEVSTARLRRKADDLTRLLQLRLVKEPSLFVLERENLMRMEEEHRWAGKVSDFWTGSYLIDGAIAHSLAETNRLQCRVSLVAPRTGKKQKQGERYEVIKTVSLERLPGYVEHVVTNLCAHLGKRTTGKSWAPLQEARAFVGLARRKADFDQKIECLETAMALGLRDAGTAGFYRNTLAEQLRAGWGRHPTRGTARRWSKEKIHQDADRLLHVLRFCNGYQLPPKSTPRDKYYWLNGCAIHDTMGRVPVLLAGRFIEVIVEAKREKDLGKDRLDTIRAECLKLERKVWFTDDGLALARTSETHLFNARNLLGTSDAIVELLRWYCSPSKTKDKKKVFPPIDRRLLDPLIPTSRTDTKEHRDALWQALLKESGALEDPECILDLLGDEYRDAPTHAEERVVRRKIHKAVYDNIEFFTSKEYGMSNHFILRHKAYPDWDFEKGVCYRSSRRDAGERVPMDEAREVAAEARKFFLKLLEIRPLMPGDEGGTVGSYWPITSREDAKRLFLAIRRNGKKFQDVPGLEKTLLRGSKIWVKKRDTHELLTKLIGLFPWLRDKEYEDDCARRDKARVTEEQGRLAVTRVIGWPYETWKKHGHATRFIKGNVPYWKDGKLWFHHYGDVLMLDPDTGKVERLGSFSAPTSGHDFKSTCTVIATDSYCFFVARYKGSFLAVRDRASGKWRSANLKAFILDIMEVDKAVYALICREREGAGWKRGLVKIAPDSLELSTVLDPLTMETDTAMARKLANENWLTRSGSEIGSSLAFADGEFIVCCDAWYRPPFYGWSAKRKTWRQVDKNVWKSAREDQEPYRAASGKLGFDVVKFVGHPQKPHLLLTRPGMRDKVLWNRFRRGEKKETVIVPLQCTKDLELHHRPAILTRDSVLLRLRRDTPGFHEVPYADIKKWLLANTAFLRVADTPVAQK